MELVSTALGLPQFALHPYFTRPIEVMRLLHYDRRASDPTKGLFAAGAHTDYGFLTLLTTDGNAGLEVRLDDAGESQSKLPPQWMPVPSHPHDFIVNVGDFLHALSDGPFLSLSAVAVLSLRMRVIGCVPPLGECVVLLLPLKACVSTGVCVACVRCATRGVLLWSQSITTSQRVDRARLPSLLRLWWCARALCWSGMCCAGQDASRVRGTEWFPQGCVLRLPSPPCVRFVVLVSCASESKIRA